MLLRVTTLLLATSLGLGSCSGPSAPPTWAATIRALEPLAEPMPASGPSDWLSHHDEDGQTFAEWLADDPPLPRGQRRVLYVQPLGDFDPARRRLVERAAEYLALTFGTEVEVLADLALDVVPANARRASNRGYGEQVLSTWVLYGLLRPNLPDDAAALIAFTSSDLWPGEGWNFVFGQASLGSRVGVWSLARNGDPSESDAAARLALLRTLKTAAHETGHMFGLEHCIAWSCNMNGSNNQAEADAQPLALCPECVAKAAWAGKQGFEERYATLATWCAARGLAAEAARFERLRTVLPK